MDPRMRFFNYTNLDGKKDKQKEVEYGACREVKPFDLESNARERSKEALSLMSLNQKEYRRGMFLSMICEIAKEKKEDERKNILSGFVNACTQLRVDQGIYTIDELDMYKEEINRYSGLFNTKDRLYIRDLINEKLEDIDANPSITKGSPMHKMYIEIYNKFLSFFWL